GLSEVIDAIEKSQPRRMRGRHAADLFFGLEPHRHRVDPNIFPSQAREEEFSSVLTLEQGLKGIWDLQPPFVVNSSWRIASKHAQLLHFWPLISTRIVEEAQVDVNRK